MTIGDLIKGLQIFAKYEKDGEDCSDVAVGHDIIYAGSYGLKVSSKDEATLIAHNWFFDTETEGWAIYV